MSHRSIPVEHERVIAELIQQKRSVRWIAEFLRTRHDVKTTHMSVFRVVERLRYSLAEPNLEAELQEVRANVPHHLRTLEALSEQFAELAVLAMEGDPEQDLPPNPKVAAQFMSKHVNVVKTLLRFLERFEGKEAAAAAKKAQEKKKRDEAMMKELDRMEKEAESLSKMTNGLRG